MNHYEKHKHADPALPFIFHRNRIRQNSSRLANWHENIEVLCFFEGNGSVRIDNCQYCVEAGDLVIVNSNCLHSLETDQMLRYYCLIIDRSFCVANYMDTNNIRFKVHLRDERCSALFSRLAALYGQSEDTAWRAQSIRALVMELLATLCREYSGACDDSYGEQSHLLSCIKHAVGLISSEFHRDLSLDEICLAAGFSKYYFVREFKRVTGYTILNCIHMTRCENAKRLLVEGELSIAEISARCGFSGQSYFARIFKRFVGVSPMRYRQSYVGSRHRDP